ncbi:hypothetical protein [Flammeovirga sp. EKP202]|uniref:hypothetical protein n=1 Tax=Flammeovirga sp. EKP202 TaxID=2770592 RepID=UPI00165F6E2D|nr:hypothetical protein [Flammeovirga sp. EKP202]MBD0400609.1 hypothetical protein [Flammeovirga sp. EKP202]
MKKLFTIALLFSISLVYGLDKPMKIEMSNFTMTLDESARPVSLKDVAGKELLISKKSLGFYLLEKNRSQRFFDVVKKVGENKYQFSMSSSTEMIEVEVGGKAEYCTFRFTKLENFPLKGERLFFGLYSKNQNIQSLALDYMTYSDRRKRNQIEVERRSLWDISDENPLGGFAIYLSRNEQQEDNALFDIWVNEGLPHPKVKGKWTKAKAKAWLDEWIETSYDVSNINILPKTPEELDEFLPYAKMMDAKGIYEHPVVWNAHTFDGVNEKIYPKGLEDLVAYKDHLKEEGLRLNSHRMSGTVRHNDELFVQGKEGVHPDIEFWGKVTLKKNIGLSSNKIIVVPTEGTEFPTIYRGGGRSVYGPPVYMRAFTFENFKIGDEWIKAKKMKDLGDGTWELSQIRRGVYGSKATKHTTEETMTGYLCGNGAVFQPGPNTALFEELADRWATLSNKLELVNANFDGAEWNFSHGVWGFEKFASLTYQKLDHPTWSMTSHGIPPEAWLEYRFNKTKKAFGGKYLIQDAIRYFAGNESRITPSIEEIEYQLLDLTLKNSRIFSIADGTRGIALEELEKNGNIEPTLHKFKEYKKVSFALSPQQRKYINVHRKIENAKLPLSGHKPMGTASWRLDGNQLRKWYSVGTETYTNEWFIGQEHGCVTPRFYVQNGQDQSLIVPKEIKSDFEAFSLIGRVLPKFDPESEENIALLPLMKLDNKITVARTNTKKVEHYDLKALKEYSIPKTDLVHHRGIGLYVTGDNSGATLVVRVSDGHLARDYAIPVNFSGRKWIEIPTGEQGWRVRNWHWCPKTKKVIHYHNIKKISVGLGYVPADTKASVTIEELQALKEINEGLVNPQFTVGGQSFKIKNTIATGNHFELKTDGNFVIYDEYWNKLSEQKVKMKKQPTTLSQLKIESKDSKAIWLEVGLQGISESMEIPEEASKTVLK